MLPTNTKIALTASPCSFPRSTGAAAPVNGIIPCVPVAFRDLVVVAFGAPAVRFPATTLATIEFTMTLDCGSANVAVDPLYNRLGESESNGADVTTEITPAVAAELEVGPALDGGIWLDTVVEAGTGEVVSPAGPGTTDTALRVDVVLERTMREGVLVSGVGGLETVLKTTGMGWPMTTVLLVVFVENDVDELEDGAAVDDTEDADELAPEVAPVDVAEAGPEADVAGDVLGTEELAGTGITVSDATTTELTAVSVAELTEVKIIALCEAVAP
ncbi:MAG: hypothetical protein M1822_008057 [Bathelium mastoideum]|nr:MAG: hypothetical protein M1822_008057 [Bathelium mastoideum]